MRIFNARFGRLPNRPDCHSGPPSLLFIGYRVLCRVSRGQGVTFTPSLPSSAEDKNDYSYISTPLYAFMTSTGPTLDFTVCERGRTYH